MHFRLIIFTGLLFSIPAFGNIIGSDHQNFNPAYSVNDYITVHGAKPLGKGQLSLGLHLNYAVNTLPYFNNNLEDNPDTYKEYNDSLSGMDFNVALGITPNLDINIAIPHIVHQEVRNNSVYHGQFNKMGNTEIRAGIKWMPIPLDFWGLSVVATANYNRVVNNPYTGDEKWPAYSLELVGEIDFGLISTAINIGHRWRNSGSSIAFDNDTPIEPFQDQWLFSAGWGLKIPSTYLRFILESYGSYTNKDFSSISPRNASVAEGVAALRYEPNKSLFFQVGAGSEMRHAISSADQRYFLGMAWSFDPFPARKKLIPHIKKVKVLSARLAPDEIVVLEDVLFDFNSDRVRSSIERIKLRRLDRVLKSRTIEKLVIEGHACAIGTEIYNMDLSERRADSVVAWIVDRFGFPREKVIPVGFGEQRPFETNKSDSDRRRNRRVRFKVYYQK